MLGQHSAHPGQLASKCTKHWGVPPSLSQSFSTRCFQHPQSQQKGNLWALSSWKPLAHSRNRQLRGKKELENHPEQQESKMGFSTVKNHNHMPFSSPAIALHHRGCCDTGSQFFGSQNHLAHHSSVSGSLHHWLHRGGPQGTSWLQSLSAAQVFDTMLSTWLLPARGNTRCSALREVETLPLYTTTAAPLRFLSMQAPGCCQAKPSHGCLRNAGAPQAALNIPVKL